MGKIRQVTTRVMQPSPSPRTQAQVTSTVLNPDTKFMKYEKLIAYQSGAYTKTGVEIYSLFDPVNMVTFGGDFLDTTVAGEEYLKIPQSMLQVPTHLRVEAHGNVTVNDASPAAIFSIRASDEFDGSGADAELPLAQEDCIFSDFIYTFDLPLKSGTSVGQATLMCDLLDGTNTAQPIGKIWSTTLETSLISYDGTAPLNLYVFGTNNHAGASATYNLTVRFLTVKLFN